MNFCLKAMEDRLDENEKKWLKSIYEPIAVATPPCDAARSMRISEDGEIRLYGTAFKKEPKDIGTPYYISSSDCGLTWKKHFIANKKTLWGAGYNPNTKRYIEVYPSEFRKGENAVCEKEGTWAVICDGDPDEGINKFVKLTDKSIHCLKNPNYISSINKWFILGQHTNGNDE